MASETFYRRRRVLFFALAGLTLGTAGAIAPAGIFAAQGEEATYGIQAEGGRVSQINSGAPRPRAGSSVGTRTEDVELTLRGPDHHGTPTQASMACTVTVTQGGATTQTIGVVDVGSETESAGTIRGYGQVASGDTRERETSTDPNWASFGVLVRKPDGTQGAADGGFQAINNTETFVSGRVVVRITGKLVHTITDSHGVTITRTSSDNVQCGISPGPSSTAQARYDIE